MQVVYIAGSYRADTEWGLVENIRRAEAAAIRLWKQGYAVICPQKNTAHFGGLCDDSIWLEGDIEILKRCDIIYMLRGFHLSKGSCEELRIAVQNNIKVIYEQDDIRLL